MRHGNDNLIDRQYRPRSIPTLAEINALDEEGFASYLRRGCRPEPTDTLYLIVQLEQLAARVEALEAQARAVLIEGQS